MELGNKFQNSKKGEENLGKNLSRLNAKQKSFKNSHFQAYVYSLIQKVLKEYLTQSYSITFKISKALEINLKLKDKFEAMNLQMQKEEIEEKILAILKEKNLDIEAVNLKIRLN